MNTVQEIEQAIQKLNPQEVAELKAWLFDRDIEHDAAAGRLDSFVEEAVRDHREGRSRPL